MIEEVIRPSTAPWAADVEELREQTARLASTLGALAQFAVDESGRIDTVLQALNLVADQFDENMARLERLEAIWRLGPELPKPWYRRLFR